jgi:beta-glucanase (GH16 family)
MNKIVAFAFLVFVSISVYCQVYPPELLLNGCSFHSRSGSDFDSSACNEQSYKLVFVDEFDSTRLDLTKWQNAYPWSRSGPSKSSETGWEKQYYADENVSISNGKLKLTTKVDPADRFPDLSGRSVFFRYTSGIVISRNEYSKGKFEIKCKIPEMDGLFPAFWLYGYCSQEIDGFEFTNASDNSDKNIDAGHVIMTYHKAYDCLNDERGNCESPFTFESKVDLSKDFHLYSIEWDDYKMIWRLDGMIIREVYRYWYLPTTTPSGPIITTAIPLRSSCDVEDNLDLVEFQPFPKADIKMRLIINTAVLLDRAADAPPREFLIDFVKIYEPETMTKVNEPVMEFDIIVFPNPTSGSFTVSSRSNSQKIQSIELVDMSGKVVFQNGLLETRKFEYTSSDQFAGVYVLKIKSSDVVNFKKILFYPQK